MSYDAAARHLPHLTLVGPLIADSPAGSPPAPVAMEACQRCSHQVWVMGIALERLNSGCVKEILCTWCDLLTPNDPPPAGGLRRLGNSSDPTEADLAYLRAAPFHRLAVVSCQRCGARGYLPPTQAPMEIIRDLCPACFHLETH